MVFSLQISLLRRAWFVFIFFARNFFQEFRISDDSVLEAFQTIKFYIQMEISKAYINCNANYKKGVERVL
jgi:hypothetical protein